MKAAWRLRRLAMALWAAGLLLSALAALLLLSALAAASEMRPLAARLDAPGVDILALAFVLREARPQGVVAIAAGAAALWAIAGLWLRGGVLAALRDARAPTLREFADRASAHAGAMARVLVLSLCGWAAVALLAAGSLWLAGKIAERAVLAQAPALWHAGLALPALALAAAWGFSADLARARIVCGDARPARRVLGACFVEALRAPGRVARWLGWWIAAIAATAAALAVVHALPFSGGAGVLALFLVRQAFAYGRTLARFAQLHPLVLART